MTSALRARRVLVVGAGGLGCPVSVGLAAAGVGTIALVDHDTIDATNLGRQSMFGDADVGKAKSETLARALLARFRGVSATFKVEKFGPSSLALLTGSDVVVDATDHFPTRFLLNDLCVAKGVPLVHGAALQWLGQVLTIVPGKTACLRCVFEGEPKTAGPTCADAGVVAPLVGVIGSWMSEAALEVLSSPGRVLSGLRVLDAWTGRERFAPVDRDPRCPSCGHIGRQ